MKANTNARPTIRCLFCGFNPTLPLYMALNLVESNGDVIFCQQEGMEHRA
jgi:hypothetical protein